MKVLLLSANTERINMPVLPLGLACVAEAAKNAGHDVAMVDLMAEMDGKAVLAEMIADFQPECIGVSVRNIDDQHRAAPQFLLEKVKAVTAACRDLSTAPIILGGAGYSMFPQSALAYLDADFGIAGEGETAFPALLAALENNTDPAAVPGLYSRGHGCRRAKTYCSDLDRLPLPQSGILAASLTRNGEPWIPVQTRRGCALQCSYCSTSSIEGTVLRRRSPEILGRWLAGWVAAGYRNFFFVDNTFNLPPSYAKALCRQILENNLAMHWRCIIYPKNVDEELVELMAAAGCRHVSLGFESGSAPMLRNLNKRFTPEDVRTASTLFARQGIERMGFLLLGGPGETRHTVEESLAFADSLDLDGLKLTAGIRIYPDTQLAAIALSQGVISAQSNLLYPHFYLSSELADWLPERLEQWGHSRPHVLM